VAWVVAGGRVGVLTCVALDGGVVDGDGIQRDSGGRVLVAPLDRWEWGDPAVEKVRND